MKVQGERRRFRARAGVVRAVTQCWGLQLPTFTMPLESTDMRRDPFWNLLMERKDTGSLDTAPYETQETQVSCENILKRT